MGRIEQEKNLLKIYITNEKPYVIDVNTGIFYGIRGGAIKSVPVGLDDVLEAHTFASCVLTTIKLIFFNANAKGFTTELINQKNSLILADRLNSAGFSPYLIGSWIFDEQYRTCIEKNFTNFIREAEEEEGSFSVGRFISLVGFEGWLKECNIEIPHHEIKGYKDYLKEYFYLDVCVHSNRHYPEAKSLIKKYGKWMTYFLINRGLYTSFINSYSEEFYVPRKLILDFFHICEKIEKEPQKADFLKQFTEYEGIYELKKKEIDNALLKKVYQPVEDKLSYEDEEFIVKIPTTTDEFYDEAEMQNNCVYRMYLPTVLDDKTYVVFVRKKNDINHSFITCEVSKAGKIIQFLKKNNERGSNEPIFEKYSHHLKEKFLKS